MMRLAFALALLLATPAQADTAEALFRAGDFEAAVAAGRGADSAAGDALAARALLTVAAYRTTSRALAEKQIATALEDARRALKRDPENIEAMLQLAIGTGYRAKLQQMYQNYASGLQRFWGVAPGPATTGAYQARVNEQAAARLGTNT